MFSCIVPQAFYAPSVVLWNMATEQSWITITCDVYKVVYWVKWLDKFLLKVLFWKKINKQKKNSIAYINWPHICFCVFFRIKCSCSMHFSFFLLYRHIVWDDSSLPCRTAASIRSISQREVFCVEDSGFGDVSVLSDRSDGLKFSVRKSRTALIHS